MTANRTIPLAFLLLLFSIAALGVSAKPEGKLVIALQSLGNETLDHVRGSGGPEEALFLTMGEPLVLSRWDHGEMAFKPGLAVSWRISKDRKSWRFVLREDVVFHDDTRFSARDVAYSWERILKSRSSRSVWAKKWIRSVEAVDDSEAVFNLKGPDSFLLSRVAPYAVQPRTYSLRVGQEAFSKHPVYAGPWKFLRHIRADRVEMRAFERHYRKVPHAKTLVIRKVSDPTNLLAALRTGEVDVWFGMTPQPAMKSVEEDSGMRLLMRPETAMTSLVFNGLRKPASSPTRFRNLRIRRALSHALDRRRIAERIYFGAAKPAAVFGIPKGSSRWNPACTTRSHDLRRASALLDAAGYPDGFKTTLVAGKSLKHEADAIASMWVPLGVEAEVRILEDSAFRNAFYARRLPEGLALITAAATPLGLSDYFREEAPACMIIDGRFEQLARRMTGFTQGSDMDRFIRDEMCALIWDLVPVIPVVQRFVAHAVNAAVGTDEWVANGTTLHHFGTAAEYLRPRR